MIYSFSGNRLDTGRHVLVRDGAPVAVEPQVFDILCLLVRNAGQLVTKDRLIDEIWDGRIVSEASISSGINAARTAVGDNGRDQRIIRTVPRRGFEMVAEITADERGTAEAQADLRQTIRYVAAPDGRSIAWSSAGEGPPVLYASHHLSHLEKDWASDLHAPWHRALAGAHRVIRFDNRGTGLSDRITPEDTLDDHVADMLAVADAAGLERFPIVAWLQAGAVAVRFAARHPERVSRLVLLNSYARGRLARGQAPAAPGDDPFISLIRSGGWGDPADGFMRAWATMVVPMAGAEQTTDLIRLIAHAGTTEDALLQRDLIDNLDVTEDLARVQAPTLVIHTRMCAIHPATEGRRVAAGIRDAEFIEVDSSNTIIIAGDPTIDRVIGAVLEFLGADQSD
ncbi:MAG: alpha/beta hydrolase [Boseongicola sp.]|nr:alpha/beta hydrolase [Silicimonas sp.]NNF92807.1 alpha/beta hydrolase [Boseongicola sp.]